MENPRKFVFLHPEKAVFELSIERYCNWAYDSWSKARGHLFNPERAKTEEERQDILKRAFQDMKAYFKPIYAKKMNSCIEYRYRKNGFQVFYVVSEDSTIDVVKLKPDDRVLFTSQPEKGNYPSPDLTIDALLPLDTLMIGGFHMWDCVERLAKRAYERGINTLVDEDLTEFFGFRAFVRHKDFRVKTYPSFKPLGRKELFLQARRDRPWLWQEY